MARLPMCGAQHPEHPELVCTVSGNHADHSIRVGSEWVWWKNEDYVPLVLPQAKTTRQGRKSASGKLAEVMGFGAPEPLRRTDDPETSHSGAESVVYRAGTHKAMMLVQYARTDAGLTDEEAARGCGLFFLAKCCWWHRASDLRKDGMIEPSHIDGVLEKRVSASSGEENMVCRITSAGVALADQLMVTAT